MAMPEAEQRAVSEKWPSTNAMEGGTAMSVRETCQKECALASISTSASHGREGITGGSWISTTGGEARARAAGGRGGNRRRQRRGRQAEAGHARASSVCEWGEKRPQQCFGAGTRASRNRVHSGNLGAQPNLGSIVGGPAGLGFLT